MSEAQAVTISQLKKDSAAPEASMPSVKVGFDNLQGFSLMQRVANALAQSTLVPQQFQNNLPNCLIGLEMAQRIGASPLMVMQNLYVVYGRPGWSSKFLIASFNQCGRFSAVRYDWTGTQGKDDWGCRAWATEKASGERIQGPLITIKLARDENWYDKKGSKWQTMPELMLMYRAAAWMINSHAPEISMGLHTTEELGDTFDATPSQDGQFRVTQDDLNRAVPATVATINQETGDAENKSGVDRQVRESGSIESAAGNDAGSPADPTIGSDNAISSGEVGARHAAIEKDLSGKASGQAPSIRPAVEIITKIRSIKTLDALDEYISVFDGSKYNEQERAGVQQAYQGRREVLQDAKPAGRKGVD